MPDLSQQPQAIISDPTRPILPVGVDMSTPYWPLPVRRRSPSLYFGNQR